jgi:hypothetical protein
MRVAFLHGRESRGEGVKSLTTMQSGLHNHLVCIATYNSLRRKPNFSYPQTDLHHKVDFPLVRGFAEVAVGLCHGGARRCIRRV